MDQNLRQRILGAVTEGLNDKQREDEARRLQEQETARNQAQLTLRAQTLLDGLDELRSMPQSKFGYWTSFLCDDLHIYIRSTERHSRILCFVIVKATGAFKVQMDRTTHEGTAEETLIFVARKAAENGLLSIPNT